MPNMGTNNHCCTVERCTLKICVFLFAKQTVVERKLIMISLVKGVTAYSTRSLLMACSLERESSWLIQLDCCDSSCGRGREGGREGGGERERERERDVITTRASSKDHTIVHLS